MSDALTDIARDQQRAEAHDVYLAALADWLEKPTRKRRAALLAAADDCDNVRRGYFSGPTQLGPTVETTADKLKAGDAVKWAALLRPLVKDGAHRYDKTAKRLLALSPFAGKTLITVFQGCGFADYGGDMSVLLGGAMKQAHADQKERWAAMRASREPHSTGDYLIVLDPAGATPPAGYKTS